MNRPCSVRELHTITILLGWAIVSLSLGCGDSAFPGGASDPLSASPQDAGKDAGGPQASKVADAALSSAPCDNLKVYPAATPAGATLTPRPVGSIVSLVVAVQGPRVLVVNAIGVRGPAEASDPPAKAGFNSGYRFELRDANDAVLYTRFVRDPSILEGPAGGGGLLNATLSWCDEKVMQVQLPNDPKARSIVLFASADGTRKPASELARFGL